MPAAGLEVNTWDQDGVVLLDLSGQLTALEAPALLDAVDAAARRSAENLQLGLRGVAFIDSGGVQALARVRDRMLSAEIPMQLLGPSVRVRRVLEVTSLWGLFDVVE